MEWVLENMPLLSAATVFVIGVVFIVIIGNYFNSPQYILDKIWKQMEKTKRAGEACSENASLLINDWHLSPEEITSHPMLCITRDETLGRLDALAGLIDEYGEKLQEKGVIPPVEFIDLIDRVKTSHSHCNQCWEQAGMKEKCALAYILEHGSPDNDGNG